MPRIYDSLSLLFLWYKIIKFAGKKKALSGVREREIEEKVVGAGVFDLGGEKNEGPRGGSQGIDERMRGIKPFPTRHFSCHSSINLVHMR